MPKLTPVLFFFSAFNRKTGEPPLINGWIPYLGKALIFRKDAYKFLLDQQKKFGDIFTVHIAGEKYFSMYLAFVPSVKLNNNPNV